jgi:hypothetical protein
MVEALEHDGGGEVIAAKLKDGAFGIGGGARDQAPVRVGRFGLELAEDAFAERVVEFADDQSLHLLDGVLGMGMCSSSSKLDAAVEVTRDFIA